MTSYESITRQMLGEQEEALHIADETNCVQWIEISWEPHVEPFPMLCEAHGEVHQWRTAWVIA